MMNGFYLYIKYRHDLQDYQDFLGLVQQYLVHPVDPVKNKNSNALKFPFRSNWPPSKGG